MHLEYEMGSCHACDHLRIPSSWFCRSFVEDKVTLVYSLMSSANSLAVVILISKGSVMSLIKMLKRSGSRTLPSITPLVTLQIEECDEPMRTNCLLLVKNALIQR